tara:strand:+ start:4838 stop:5686 length:849 start_codon:yes stop_codon:yes gene_type:complete
MMLNKLENYLEILLIKISLINSTLFNTYFNLCKEDIDIFTSNKKYSFYNNRIDYENINIYIIFEVSHIHHSAFSHWVYESFILLNALIEKINILKYKILIKKNPERKFKKLFLNLLNIKNIEYYENNLPKNNFTISCNNFTLNNKNINIKKFKEIIDKYCLLFENISSEKEIEYLFLPRNTSQNFQANDRKINYNNVMKFLKDKTYISYDTINTNNLIDQIKLIKSSKNIILDYGSNFFVNGLFAKNSKIIVCNNLNQHTKFPCWVIIMEKMKRNKNEIIFL